LQGEPGIGKTTIAKELAPSIPNHLVTVMDCTNMDLGDIAMPRVAESEGTFVTFYAPNARFRVHEAIAHQRPVFIMLDELTKATQSVKNMLLPLLLEHRLGDVELPKGSIVVGTGNLAGDNVGDSLQAHARNRITSVHVSKPDYDQWSAWAINNFISPMLIAFARQYPQVLASYLDDGQDENPYVYNPKRQQQAFVTPRSLAKSSPIVEHSAQVSSNALTMALNGTIGAAATADFMAFKRVGDTLPDFRAIIANPEKAGVPDSPIGQIITVFSGIQQLDSPHLDPWMTYINRLTKEVQALFASDIIRSKKAGMAVQNASFTRWCVDNGYLY
jgi:hypothetical protein